MDLGDKWTMDLDLGFYGMLRVSELANMVCSDIFPSENALVLRINVSKTDQKRKGQLVKLNCPKNDRKHMLAISWVSSLPATGFAFGSLDGSAVILSWVLMVLNI